MFFIAYCFGQEFLALLERIKEATTEADLEECQREYERQRSGRKRRRKVAGAVVRPDNTSMICQGLCLAYGTGLSAFWSRAIHRVHVWTQDAHAYAAVGSITTRGSANKLFTD